MLDLSLGAKVATKVFGVGNVEDRWIVGIITDKPNPQGFVPVKFSDATREVAMEHLRRVAPSAKKARLGDVIVLDDNFAVDMTPAVLAALLNNEQLREEDEVAERLLQRREASARRRAEAEKRERANRAKREARRRDARLVELGFEISDEGLTFVGTK